MMKVWIFIYFLLNKWRSNFDNQFFYKKSDSIVCNFFDENFEPTLPLFYSKIKKNILPRSSIGKIFFNSKILLIKILSIR